VTTTTSLTLQPRWVGEIPPPTDVTVTDADGAVYNCTGASSVTFKYSVDRGTVATCTATAVTPASGIFRISWDAAAFDAAGILRGALWFTLSGARIVAAVVTIRIQEPPVPIT
jgi:hypothetical protein